MITLQRWRSVWNALGARGDDALFAQMVAKYSEPQRHYHTLKHLEECLSQLDAARTLAVHPHEVEIALWFHDAIYDVQAHDNEARSAEWAYAQALAAGLSTDVAERIRELVLITRHNARPATDDQALLVDIDLSILGATPERFAEYDAAIRKEYSWVPSLVYRIKRRGVLKGFLERDAIFMTAYFHERYEVSARANLQQSLQK